MEFVHLGRCCDEVKIFSGLRGFTFFCKQSAAELSSLCQLEVKDSCEMKALRIGLTQSRRTDGGR